MKIIFATAEAVNHDTGEEGWHAADWFPGGTPEIVIKAALLSRIEEALKGQPDRPSYAMSDMEPGGEILWLWREFDIGLNPSGAHALTEAPNPDAPWQGYEFRPDEDPDPAEIDGFEAFRASRALFDNPHDASSGLAAEWSRGWWRGYALAFAEGVLASADGDEAESPYPQFSSAWEAWADGHNAHGAGRIVPGAFCTVDRDRDAEAAAGSDADKVAQARAILANVNENSEPDAMAEAIARLSRIIEA